MQAYAVFFYCIYIVYGNKELIWKISVQCRSKSNDFYQLELIYLDKLGYITYYEKLRSIIWVK